MKKTMRAHVDLLEGVHQGQMLLVLVLLVAVEQFADQPEDAEAEEDAHEGRQMGDGLEDRHADQDAEPHAEHQVLLERGGLDSRCRSQPLTGLTTSRPSQDVAGDGQRHDQVDHRGEEDPLHDGQGGDLPADPEHGGGDVADRRPGAAGIGGDDDDAGEEQPVVVLVEQLLHQRDHDDGGGQVVEHRAEEEGDEADQPHQRRELGGLDARGDDLEAVVGIDHLDDGHRPHQEEDDLRRPRQRFAQLLARPGDDRRSTGHRSSRAGRRRSGPRPTC